LLVHSWAVDRAVLALGDVDELVEEDLIVSVEQDVFLVLIKCLVLILQRLVVALVLDDLLKLHRRLHGGFDTSFLLLVNHETSAHKKEVKGDGARTYLYS